MELTEVKQNELYKNGNLIKLGNYHIGSEITYGVHIPVYTRPQAEVVMKEILFNQKLKWLVEEGLKSNLKHDENCIHNQGNSKCVNCHVKSYLEFILEEANK